MSETRYIAVEGPIGVGKTSLARRLADTFGCQLVEELPEANPFLERFYEDRAKYAFQTQLFFLLSRYQQQRDLQQPELFKRSVISDCTPSLTPELGMQPKGFTLSVIVALFLTTFKISLREVPKTTRQRPDILGLRDRESLTPETPLSAS